MLRQPKNACKVAGKSEKAALPENDISVDGKSKNCGTAGKGNKGEGEIKE